MLTPEPDPDAGLPTKEEMAAKLAAMFVRTPGNWGPVYRAKRPGYVVLRDGLGRRRRVLVEAGNRLPQSMVDQMVDFQRQDQE